MCEADQPFLPGMESPIPERPTALNQLADITSLSAYRYKNGHVCLHKVRMDMSSRRMVHESLTCRLDTVGSRRSTLLLLWSAVTVALAELQDDEGVD